MRLRDTEPRKLLCICGRVSRRLIVPVLKRGFSIVQRSFSGSP